MFRFWFYRLTEGLDAILKVVNIARIITGRRPHPPLHGMKVLLPLLGHAILQLILLKLINIRLRTELAIRSDFFFGLRRLLLWPERWPVFLSFFFHGILFVFGPPLNNIIPTTTIRVTHITTINLRVIAAVILILLLLLRHLPRRPRRKLNLIEEILNWFDQVHLQIKLIMIHFIRHMQQRRHIRITRIKQLLGVRPRYQIIFFAVYQHHWTLRLLYRIDIPEFFNDNEPQERRPPQY